MKYVLFTDIHFGNHNNSDIYNQQCLDFLDFMDEWCSENINEEFTTVFLGDWYHNRNAINVKTLNYANEGMVKLSNIGEKQFMLLGNHDLFYKDRRDISSIIIPQDASGIEVITEPMMNNDVLLCPWLIENESLKDLIQEHSPKYVLGHFELPSFKLNSKIIMPGEFNPFDYYGPEKIISGHYHTSSEKANVLYMGACFSHDFSDTNDWNNKGFVILDTVTGENIRVTWKDAPKYLVTKLSTLETIKLENNMHLRLINDTDMDEEKIAQLREALETNENIIECQILPKELTLDADVESIEMNDIGNMNVIIPEMLKNVSMDGINSTKLINIYNSLEVQ